MENTLRAGVAAIGLAILAAASVSVAGAQCAGLRAPAHGASLLRQRSWTGEVRHAVLSPRASAGAETSRVAEEPIVGLWKVRLLSKGNAGVPDGTLLDVGYAQWHSDGTELMNSSRPPATGSFCMGTWKKTGPSTYKLNHFAIGWKSDGTMLGPTRLQETVTVSRDKGSFTGTFTIDQYDKHGTLQQHTAGRIEGTRITVTTSIGGALLD